MGMVGTLRNVYSRFARVNTRISYRSKFSTKMSARLEMVSIIYTFCKGLEHVSVWFRTYTSTGNTVVESRRFLLPEGLTSLMRAAVKEIEIRSPQLFMYYNASTRGRRVLEKNFVDNILSADTNPSLDV